MSIAIEELPVRPKRDTFLIVSITLLVLFTTGFLVGAFAYYHHHIHSITLRESRFLRVEWNLLRDLKAQTDRELLQKDQEIADLNRRYLSLVRESGTAAQLRQVQSLLQQAQTQRKALMSQLSEVKAPSHPQNSGWLVKLLPSSENGSPVSTLLQQRITALEAQLKESRQQSAELAKVLAATNTRFGAAERALLKEIALRKRGAGSVEQPRIEELDTRALVRAIIGSPEVRSKYPNLLHSLDVYLREYGLQERVKGSQEAYAAVDAQLKRFAQATSPSTPPASPAGKPAS